MSQSRGEGGSAYASGGARSGCHERWSQTPPAEKVTAGLSVNRDALQGCSRARGGSPIAQGGWARWADGLGRRASRRSGPVGHAASGTPHRRGWKLGMQGGRWKRMCGAGRRGVRKVSPELRRRTVRGDEVRDWVSSSSCIGTALAMREASLASCRRGSGGRASGPAAVGARERRTTRCRRDSGPQHGSRSQAGGPSQRQRRSARAVGSPRGIGGRRQPEEGSAGQFERCCPWRCGVLLLTGGRESPRADFSGRTGAGGGNLAGGSSKRRSILATVPAAPTLPAYPPHRCPVQRTHLGAICRAPLLRSPITTPMPPPPLSLVSDCPVPCYVMVRPEYAYSSALLWADLP